MLSGSQTLQEHVRFGTTHRGYSACSCDYFKHQRGCSAFSNSYCLTRVNEGFLALPIAQEVPLLPGSRMTQNKVYKGFLSHYALTTKRRPSVLGSRSKQNGSPKTPPQTGPCFVKQKNGGQRCGSGRCVLKNPPKGVSL